MQHRGQFRGNPVQFGNFRGSQGQHGNFCGRLGQGSNLGQNRNIQVYIQNRQVTQTQNPNRSAWSAGHAPATRNLEHNIPVVTATSPFRYGGGRNLSSLRATEYRACRPRPKRNPLKPTRIAQSAKVLVIESANGSLVKLANTGDVESATPSVAKLADIVITHPAKVIIAQPEKNSSRQLTMDNFVTESVHNTCPCPTGTNIDQGADTHSIYAESCLDEPTRHSEEKATISVEHVTGLQNYLNSSPVIEGSGDFTHEPTQSGDGDIICLLNELPEETGNDIDFSKPVIIKTEPLDDFYTGTDVEKLEEQIKNTAINDMQQNVLTVEEDFEFDLEEIEIVPTLHHDQSVNQRKPAPNKDIKEPSVVGQKVEKGIQNLRNLFKGRMVLPSSIKLEETPEEAEGSISLPIEKSLSPPIENSVTEDSVYLPIEKSVSPTFDKSVTEDSVSLPIEKSVSPPFEKLVTEDSVSLPIEKSMPPPVDKSVSAPVEKSVYTGYSEATMPSSEEDSDDEDLSAAPSYLQKLSDLKKFTELADDDKSITSSKKKSFTNLSDSEPESEALDMLEPISEESGLSLDLLLTERNNLEENDRQLAKIEDELQDGLRKGGVSKLELEGGDDLLPEHQQKLKKMEMAEQVIQEHHPGESVFTLARYQQVFSFPETLTLESCGFKAGKSRIDQNLTTLQPDMLCEFLTQEVVVLCFQAISCPHAFLTWLFQLISVHSDCLVAQKSYTLMHSVLRLSPNKAADWVPDVQTIVRVFVNLGAHRNTLCPWLGTLSAENKEHICQTASQHGPDGECENQGQATFKFENLRLVLRVIADVTHLRCKSYKAEDLLTIIIMVFKVSLDTRLNNKSVDYDVQVCLSSLLHAIASKDWPSQVTELCRVFPHLTTHHHNRVHLVELLPPCERGRYIQRRVAYATLHTTLIGSDATTEILTHLRLHHLHPLVDRLQLKGQDVDFYLVSSIVSMINFAVGNEALPAKDENALVTLTSILKNKMGDLREYIHIMDRTVVKDQLVRLTAKWMFMAKNMGSRERTIFAYATASEPIQIESVLLQDQEEDSEPEDTDDVTMD